MTDVRNVLLGVVSLLDVIIQTPACCGGQYYEMPPKSSMPLWWCRVI